MADFVIVMQQPTWTSAGTDLTYFASAFGSQGPGIGPFSLSTTQPLGATPHQIALAIRDAMVTMAANFGITVQPNDSIVMIGAPQNMA